MISGAVRPSAFAVLRFTMLDLSLNRHHRLRQFLVQSALFLGAELQWLENCDKFPKRSGKAERHVALVLLQHRSSGVLSNIEGFIERKASRYRLGDPALRDLLFVDQ